MCLSDQRIGTELNLNITEELEKHFISNLQNKAVKYTTLFSTTVCCDISSFQTSSSLKVHSGL